MPIEKKCLFSGNNRRTQSVIHGAFSNCPAAPDTRLSEYFAHPRIHIHKNQADPMLEEALLRFRYPRQPGTESCGIKFGKVSTLALALLSLTSSSNASALTDSDPQTSYTKHKAQLFCKNSSTATSVLPFHFRLLPLFNLAGMQFNLHGFALIIKIYLYNIINMMEHCMIISRQRIQRSTQVTRSRFCRCQCCKAHLMLLIPLDFC